MLALFSMVAFCKEYEWLRGWAEEDGYDISDPEEEVWWFGRKVE